MTTILQLNNSLFGDNGKSSRLADAFVAQWREREPEVRVIRRDLARDPIPHLSLEAFTAAGIAPDQRTSEQARAAGLADTLVDEVLAADVLVIGLPIYNFNLPSTLKTWFDHVARAGTTFRYTSAGPEGLLRARRAYVFATSGGQYAGTPADFQAPYLKHFLGFLGIDNVSFTYAEGLAMGEQSSHEALAAANRRIADLAAG
jgi:FMN-dependent NADH-azoreductase